jgi:hypothetical protein
MPPKGAVVGFAARATAVYVLFEGRKTPAIIHVSYIEAVDA